MSITLDHVALARRDHDAAVEELTTAGFIPRFGGVHADGTTQMSLVAFRDGGYLELVAPTEATRPGETVRWPDHIADDAGPCAWCVAHDDIRAAAKRYIDAGEPVEGPRVGGRGRPDGVRIEWDELFVGSPADRHALPFGISDRTPRERRVPPAWAHDGPAGGLERVVVAVPELDPWVERFRRLYRLPAPELTDDTRLDATVAPFPGAPVALAEPAGASSPLAARLDRYPPGPCAVLLGAEDYGDAAAAYDLADGGEWGGRRVGWTETFDGRSLGVLER